MPTFKRFEDIIAWQKARAITSRIYSVSAKASFAKDFGLRDQIRRASVSIMANIAEGFGRRSNKEFANFLNISHGSAAECQSHLCVAVDVGHINELEFRDLYSAFEECSKMIIALSHHLRGTRSQQRN